MGFGQLGVTGSNSWTQFVCCCGCFAWWWCDYTLEQWLSSYLFWSRLRCLGCSSTNLNSPPPLLLSRAFRLNRSNGKKKKKSIKRSSGRKETHREQWITAYTVWWFLGMIQKKQFGNCVSFFFLFYRSHRLLGKASTWQLRAVSTCFNLMFYPNFFFFF